MDLTLPSELVATFIILSTLIGVIAGFFVSPLMNKIQHKAYFDPDQMAWLGVFQMSFVRGYTEHDKQTYDKFLHACANKNYNSGYFYGLGYLYGYALWETENTKTSP